MNDDQLYKTCNTSNMSTHLPPKHEGTSSSGSFSGPTETAKVQMNLQSQLRVSNTMFVKGPLSFNSLRAHSITKAIVGFITKDMRPCSLK